MLRIIDGTNLLCIYSFVGHGHDGVTPKKSWGQRQNFTKKLRKQHLQYRGIE